MVIAGLQLITVWLNFLTQSFCMIPSLEGLTWFECGELSKEELLIRFMFN